VKPLKNSVCISGTSSNKAVLTDNNRFAPNLQTEQIQTFRSADPKGLAKEKIMKQQVKASHVSALRIRLAGDAPDPDILHSVQHILWENHH
jgi:hypothetical protein